MNVGPDDGGTTVAWFDFSVAWGPQGFRFQLKPKPRVEGIFFDGHVNIYLMFVCMWYMYAICLITTYVYIYIYSIGEAISLSPNNSPSWISLKWGQFSHESALPQLLKVYSWYSTSISINICITQIPVEFQPVVFPKDSCFQKLHIPTSPHPTNSTPHSAWGPKAIDLEQQKSQPSRLLICCFFHPLIRNSFACHCVLLPKVLACVVQCCSHCLNC